MKKTTRISDFEDPFCGLADFERSVVHGFLHMNISAWIMDFVCFKVQIAELGSLFHFFFGLTLELARLKRLSVTRDLQSHFYIF